jgi:hypothetical protein
VFRAEVIEKKRNLQRTFCFQKYLFINLRVFDIIEAELHALPAFPDFVFSALSTNITEQPGMVFRTHAKITE